MFQLLEKLDNYTFSCEETKMEYKNRLTKLCNEGTELFENLQRLETDHYVDLIKRFQQKTGQTLNQDSSFKTVKGKKNNKKSPSPPPETSNKKLRTHEVETTNRLSDLHVEDPPATENEIDENVSQAQAPKFRRTPPITIENVSNTAAFLKKLQSMTKEKLMGRVIGKGLRVYPDTPQAYHTIRNFID
ncbi:hypothetical protein TNCV_4761681 [Trichonephila clavipes]|uniref:Uncharacterized protein n=1 Tax=Trichonephila clavipes TaxID=2585209 RepID=A0A8X6RIP0_TRICX|nr:hypothetical protein TNCV_4761681 [Trichonephila clavipes]